MMPLESTAARIWAVIIISLHTTSAYSQLNSGNGQTDGGAALRKLLKHDDRDLTEVQATGVLRGVGVDRSGRIFYSSRIPSCHVEDTPASTVGQIFTLCQQAAAIRNCSLAVGRRENVTGSSVGPLFQFKCGSGICSDTWVPSSSDCDVEALFGVPLQKALQGECPTEAGHEHVSSFAPTLLQPLGAPWQEVGCIYGMPNGTQVFSEEHCDDGRRHVDVMLRLAGQGFADGGAEFWCTWDARCRDTQGCCEGDNLYEGEFICFVDTDASVQGESSGSMLGGLSRPALVVCFLVGLCLFW
ncbi:unnamed protein product [Ostreobium quekettii]|uniref:Uncharacterized protein n=1 Tax=Ostreobium quekettii TaxID=121088 RepID=A0A8S1J9V1_9CHLO|nr:unnamed protein product [Ostreobium quekettii]|eukprot:evm.model.scf_901.4 EVM.evm.TU.scf_901.4   scf_901:26055-28442(-)